MTGLPPELLEAVVARPDDDGPRLAAADWLEEAGFAGKANFVRAQVAVARLEADPYPDTAALRAAIDSEKGLLASRQVAWAVEAGYPAKAASQVAFRRGWLEEARHPVTLSPADLETLPVPPLLRVLHLRRPGGRDWLPRLIERLSGARNLRELVVEGAEADPLTRASAGLFRLPLLTTVEFRAGYLDLTYSVSADARRWRREAFAAAPPEDRPARAAVWLGGARRLLAPGVGGLDLDQNGPTWAVPSHPDGSHLRVVSPAGADWDDLSAHAGVRSLTLLHFGDLPVNRLLSLTAVEDLDLSPAGELDVARLAAWLPALPRLTHLRLNGRLVNAKQLPGVLASCTALRAVHVSEGLTKTAGLPLDRLAFVSTGDEPTDLFRRVDPTSTERATWRGLSLTLPNGLSLTESTDPLDPWAVWREFAPGPAEGLASRIGALEIRVREMPWDEAMAGGRWLGSREPVLPPSCRVAAPGEGFEWALPRRRGVRRLVRVGERAYRIDTGVGSGRDVAWRGALA